MKFIGFADEVSPEAIPEAAQEAPQKPRAKSVTPEYVASVAQRYGVNPDLARGIFRVETSSGANVATSPKGARGPMQVMPDTFKEVYPEGDINNPEDNVEAGIRYLARAQKDLGTDDPRLIAAAYHAGIWAVKKAGGVPNTNDGIMSTSDYADRVSGSSGPREGLRRIAAKKMTFVGFSDEEDPAYSRFNPPKKPVEAVDEKSPSAPISELPGDLWEAAKGLGTSFKSAWAGLVEGGDPENIDYGNAAVKEAKDRALKSAAEPGAKDPYIDFAGIKLTRDQVRTMDQSLAFSVLGMGASITGALIGSLGGPGTALAGATGFGARAAYNMDANSVARQMRDGMDAAAKQQRGEPLTDEEFAAIVKSPDMQDAAKKVGLEWNKRGSAMGEIQTHAAHEALWEGLGNVATMGFGAFIAKEAMKRGIVKPILGAIGMAGGEVLTEWPTQQGQQRAESRLGLTDEPPRQYDKWQDWATSFEEVAGPTLAQVGLTGGGAYVGGRIAGAVSGKPNEAPPTPPPADTEFTPAGLIPERPSSMQMGQMGIREGSRGKTEADVAAEQMYAERDAVEAAQRDIQVQPQQTDAGGAMTQPDALPVMPGTQERDLGAIAEDSDRAKLARLRERQMGAIQESGRDVAVEQADALTQAQGFDEPQLSPLQAAYQRAQQKKAIRAEAQQIQAEAAQRVAAGQPVADLAERARNAMAKFAALSAPVAEQPQEVAAPNAEASPAIPETQSESPIRAATPLETGSPGLATLAGGRGSATNSLNIGQVPPSSEAVITQKSLDSFAANAKALRDVVVSPAFIEKGLYGLDRQQSRIVKSAVVDVLDYLKILDPVIRANAIDVMNDFPGGKLALEKFLHNPAMLKDLFAVKSEAPVSGLGDTANSAVIGFAKLATKLSELGRLSAVGEPALNAASGRLNDTHDVSSKDVVAEAGRSPTEPPASSIVASSNAGVASGQEAAGPQSIPRLAENADDLYREIKKRTDSGVVTDRGIMYPVARVMGVGDVRISSKGIEVIENGGRTARDATSAEKDEVHDAINKDQADVVVMSHWGGSGGRKETRSKFLSRLHTAHGNSFEKAQPAASSATAPAAEQQPQGAENGLQETTQAAEAVELKNIEVTRRTFETDANGNRRELEGVKESADKALADVDQQISAIRALIECLNS
jgi:hypothetical protein